MDKIALAKRFEGFSKVFAEDSSIGVDLKAMAAALNGMTDEKFASIVNAEYSEAQDKEAFLGGSPAPGAYERRTPMTERGYGPGAPKGKTVGVPPSPQEIAEMKKKQKAVSPYGEFTPAPGAPAPVMASDSWTKEAFDHVAQNLVRDVLGMNKSVCCDTGRHLDKKQMPDATKAPELKNVRPTDQDTGRALTPEQVPDKAEALASDMYKKSQGKVRKEAAAEADTDVAEKTQAQEKDKDAAADTEKTVKDLKKKSEEAEKKEKKEKLLAQAKGKAKDAETEPVVDASDVMVEGISFDNVMADSIDANDPEIKKLSALFE